MSMILTVRNADGHHHDVIDDDFNCDYQDEKEEDENGSYISRIFSLPSLPVQVVSFSLLFCSKQCSCFFFSSVKQRSSMMWGR